MRIFHARGTPVCLKQTRKLHDIGGQWDGSVHDDDRLKERSGNAFSNSRELALP